MNFVFALWLVFMPLIQSVFALLGVYFDIVAQIAVWGICYLVFIVVAFAISNNKKQSIENLKANTKKPIFYLVMGLILTMFVSTIVNGFKDYSLIYFSCFLIFYCFYNLSESKIKNLINLLLIVVAISCVMGFVDPLNKWMPGFNEESLPLSLQFYNPNYTAYVDSICMIIVIMILKNANKIKDYIVYGLIYFIYALYLYMNGSFAPITALYFVLLMLIVYYWIRDKKFPSRLFILFLLLIPFAFVVDLIPNINAYRTCDQNYFLECVAVADNIFGTNFLSMFGIESIPGADGWNRAELLSQSFVALNPFVGNIIPFFFGYGSGYFSVLRPHNSYIGLTLDLGILTTLFYISIIIYYFIQFIKSKKDDKLVTMTAVVVLVSLIEFFGSLLAYWIWLYILILALGFKLMKKTNL